MIRSDRKSVWSVLNDLAKYHHWNSFTSAVETNWIVGSEVKLTVHMKPGQKTIIQTEFIRNYATGIAMEWGMNWGPFLKAHRIQHLRTIDVDNTEYFTEDAISGWLCPMVHYLYGKNIQSGFERMAAELKHYVEKS